MKWDYVSEGDSWTGSAAQIKARKAIAQARLELIKAVQSLKTECPAVNLYFDENNLHLMSGPSHDGLAARQRQDRVICTTSVPDLDVGAW